MSKPLALTFRWTPRNIALATAFIQAGTSTLNRHELFDRFSAIMQEQHGIKVSFKHFRQKLYHLKCVGLITYSDKYDGLIRLSDFFLAKYQDFRLTSNAKPTCSLVVDKPLLLRVSYQYEHQTIFTTLNVTDLIALIGQYSDSPAKTAVGRLDDGSYRYFEVLTPFTLKGLRQCLTDYYLIGGRYLVQQTEIADCLLRKVVHKTAIQYWVDFPFWQPLRLSYRQHKSLREIQLRLQAKQPQEKQKQQEAA